MQYCKLQHHIVFYFVFYFVFHIVFFIIFYSLALHIVSRNGPDVFTQQKLKRVSHQLVYMHSYRTSGQNAAYMKILIIIHLSSVHSLLKFQVDALW